MGKGSSEKETCGLCFTSSANPQQCTVTLPCGHYVCGLCWALDINLKEKLLSENCHICKGNAAIFDHDLVTAKVTETIATLQGWSTQNLSEVAHTTKCNLLRLYNVMQRPEDEQFLTKQFFKHDGGTTIMTCLKSLSRLIFEKELPPLPHLPKSRTPQEKPGSKGEGEHPETRDKTKPRDKQNKIKLSPRLNKVPAAPPEPVLTEAQLDEKYRKLYNVLLDTVLNFTYTSSDLCSMLVKQGLLDLLENNLKVLEDDYKVDKGKGTVVLDALGIFFNCSRTLEASDWFDKKATISVELLSYMDTEKHESAIVFLALLSLCRALPPERISKLTISLDLFLKITETLENAILDDKREHFHSFIYFDTTGSNPEFDLQELLVPIGKLAHHNVGYSQWMARRDLDSLLMFLRKGNHQEVTLTLSIIHLLTGPRTVERIVMNPGLIDTLFQVYGREDGHLKDKVWQIRTKIRAHYQSVFDATGHNGRSCHEQGHKSSECYFRDVLASILAELKLCAEADQTDKAMFILDGFERDIKRQVTALPADGNTLLFLAAKKGSLSMVKYLVEDCGANMEQTGVYDDPDSGTSHHAPPLWVASVENHVDIVKFLIETGAHVNSTSDTHSTAVRSACFDNNVEVVKYLVSHGANINQPNIHGGTCLMNSVRCLELVNFLMENDAEINSQDRYGYSALQGAVLEKEPEVIKLLVHHGADILARSVHGDDAITSACLKGQTETVEFLMDITKPGLEREIQTSELLGCYFIDDKNEPAKALELWEKAYTSRFNNGIPFPDEQNPHRIFEGLTEVKSLEDLAGLKENPEKLYRQSLMVRERILCRSHRDVSYYVMYRGAVHADHHEYKESIELWTYGLELRHMKHQTLESPIHDDCLFTLMSCSKLFWEMREEGSAEQLTFSAIFPILQIACAEILGVRKILSARPVHSNAEKDVENIMRLILHLIHLIAEFDLSMEQEELFHGALSKLMAVNVTDLNNRNLLHLAVLPSSSVVDEELHSPLPSAKVVSTLLKCGVFMNWVDHNKCTPLHLLLIPETPTSLVPSVAQSTLEEIALLLLGTGAHVDVKNADGETAMDAVSQLAINFSWASHMTLKCLAARVVNQFEIPYRDVLPRVLLPFVELH